MAALFFIFGNNKSMYIGPVITRAYNSVTIVCSVLWDKAWCFFFSVLCTNAIVAVLAVLSLWSKM